MQKTLPHWLPLLTVFCGSLLIPTPAIAQGEAVFVFGGLLGGDLLDIVEGDISLTTAFDNGTLYGGRVGWYGFPLGVEAGDMAHRDRAQPVSQPAAIERSVDRSRRRNPSPGRGARGGSSNRPGESHRVASRRVPHRARSP